MPLGRRSRPARPPPRNSSTPLPSSSGATPGLPEGRQLPDGSLVPVDHRPLGPTEPAPRFGSGPRQTIGVVTDPTPATVTSTTSPATRYRGGVRLNPTPSGVPVATTSPGFRVITSDRYARSSPTPNTMSAVVPSCTVSPLTTVVSRQPAPGSPVSSAVTISEIGPLASAFLPTVHSRECSWCVRADRSLNAA